MPTGGVQRVTPYISAGVHRVPMDIDPEQTDGVKRVTDVSAQVKSDVQGGARNITCPGHTEGAQLVAPNIYIQLGADLQGGVRSVICAHPVRAVGVSGDVLPRIPHNVGVVSPNTIPGQFGEIQSVCRKPLPVTGSRRQEVVKNVPLGNSYGVQRDPRGIPSMRNFDVRQLSENIWPDQASYGRDVSRYIHLHQTHLVQEEGRGDHPMGTIRIGGAPSDIPAGKSADAQGIPGNVPPRSTVRIDGDGRCNCRGRNIAAQEITPPILPIQSSVAQCFLHNPHPGNLDVAKNPLREVRAQGADMAYPNNVPRNARRVVGVG